MINLEIGKEYTTKEFYMAVLGEKPEKGRRAKEQKELIEKMVEFRVEKVGRSNIYTVLDIHHNENNIIISDKKINVTTNAGNIKITGKYDKYIAPMMISKLNASPNRTVLLPTTVLFEEFGMVNEEYNKKKSNIVKTSKELDVHPTNLFEMVNTVQKQFGQIVERSIKALESKKIIRAEKKTMISYYLLEENKKPIKRCIMADDDMLNVILETNFKVLEHLEIEDEKEVYIKGKNKQYYNMLNKNIKTEMNYLLQKKLDLNINQSVSFAYCFKAFEIKSTDYIIEKQLSKKDYEVNKKALNDIMINFISNNTQKLKKSKNRTNKLINNRIYYDTKQIFVEGFTDYNKQDIIEEYEKCALIVIDKLIKIL